MNKILIGFILLIILLGSSYYIFVENFGSKIKEGFYQPPGYGGGYGGGYVGGDGCWEVSGETECDDRDECMWDKEINQCYEKWCEPIDREQCSSFMKNPGSFLDDPKNTDKVNNDNYKTCYSKYIEICKPYPSDKNNYCKEIGMNKVEGMDVKNYSTEDMGKCLAHPWCDVKFSDKKKCVSTITDGYVYYCNENENENECNKNDNCEFKTVPVCVGND